MSAASLAEAAAAGEEAGRTIAELEKQLAAAEAAATEAAAFKTVAGEKLGAAEAEKRALEDEVAKAVLAAEVAAREAADAKATISRLQNKVARVSQAREDVSLVDGSASGVVVTEENDPAAAGLPSSAPEDDMVAALDAANGRIAELEAANSDLSSALALAMADLEVANARALALGRELQDADARADAAERTAAADALGAADAVLATLPPLDVSREADATCLSSFVPPPSAGSAPGTPLRVAELAAGGESSAGSSRVGTPGSPNLVLDALSSAGVTSAALKSQLKGKPLADEVRDLKRQIKQQTDYVQRLHTSLDAALADAERSKAELETKRAQVDALEAQVSTLKQQAADTRATAETLEATATSVQAAAVEAIDARMSSVTSTRVLELEAEAARLRNELIERTEERAALKRALAESDEQVRSAVALQTELHEVKGRYMRLQLEIEARGSAIPAAVWEDRLMQERVRAKEATLEREALAGALQRAEAQAREAEARAKNLDAELAGLRDKYETVVRLGPDSSTIHALRAQLHAALDDRDAARREAEAARHEGAAATHASLATSHRTLSALEDELGRLRSVFATEANELHVQLSVERSSNAALTSRIESLQIHNEQLTAQLAAAQRDAARASRLAAQLDTAQRQLDARDATISQLDIEKAALEKALRSGSTASAPSPSPRPEYRYSQGGTSYGGGYGYGGYGGGYGGGYAGGGSTAGYGGGPSWRRRAGDDDISHLL
ncbi:uncharacterized protein AMSG_10466 [Thecamonas trahens ATCC 50062]|uniref:Uncharacterized protein n=1 Tax=Thecamonas trahens ATCC 50062 TaxID=461836 RepID=A0A0L0DQ83_THETB|nr:hypothetical protein AMSG_10466 [Thecamonas trahens ATCC 50062]KNC54469.1 hypothetical protein AMSG_10466 [Thecamonas trahens ATCC 50062]|eukprot:XP_013753624.1 hypothetical protein AMSG_10466 [Thecamonas trahens ATCC 50062]